VVVVSRTGGCALKFVKEINDNIWGTVQITDRELLILDHPLLQRLRRVSQLGLVNLVYPGAGHSRLSHSIGVLALASQVGRHLCEIGDFTEQDATVLRIAALVHDVGHYPLSHSTETSYEQENKDLAGHEAVGARLICTSSLGDTIEQALDGTDIGKRDIAEAIQGRSSSKIDKPAIWQLINSQFDLDRMDYLMRDGTAVGLDYGRIDFRRILSKILVDPTTKNIGLDVKARTAIENYVLSRYYLWDTVYQHKAVMGFEIIQSEVCKLLKEEGLLPTLTELLKMAPTEEFYEFDDNWFWTSLYEGMRRNKRINALGTMLRDRHPLKLAYEAPPPLDPVLVDPNKSIIKASKYVGDESYVEHVLKGLKVPKEWFFPVRVELAIHQFLPLVEDEPYDPEYERLRQKAEETRAKTIRLFQIDKNGERKFAGYLATHPHSVVSSLSTFSKVRLRFYTTSQYEAVLRDHFESELRT